MFNGKIADRIFILRSVKEILDDAAAGYISVLPYPKKTPDKTALFQTLNDLGENPETMAELLANGDMSRLQQYCISIEFSK
ncbi:MAG: hypothetical protein IJ056_00485 [Acidaminococcaceae bacterium]|nr:hypothetical protein [Acidaminococcaceae bacterium]